MRIALTIDQGPGEACHAKNPTNQQEPNKNPTRSSLNDVDRWHIKQNSVSQEERVDSPLPRAALHISCLPISTPTLGDWILSQEPGTTSLDWLFPHHSHAFTTVCRLGLLCTPIVSGRAMYFTTLSPAFTSLPHNDIRP